MRKTCKCGNVLSDTTVPNNVVYWTISVADEDKLLLRFTGTYTKLKQIAIWYCNNCQRIYHWGSDWNLYTYKFVEKKNPKEYLIEWNSTENIYYSLNDFEKAEVANEYRKNKIFNYPRKVYGGTGFEKIYILSDNKVKVFRIEEKLSMKE